MSVRVQKDVSYRDPVQPSHSLDLYFPTTTPSDKLLPLVVFVHGGAWRSEDKAHHADLANKLVEQTHLPVAVVNYRLTTPTTHLHHPAHAEDVLAALQFLHTANPHADYDVNRIYLMGHSCGAHILSSIFLDSSATTPSLTPTPTLVTAVQAIIVSEGIYDIDVLLRSFPDYREWFIADTFSERDSYADVSVTSFPLRENGAHIRWLVIQSPGDKLIDILQAQTFFDHLVSLHRASGSESFLRFDKTTFTQNHNDVLKEEGFARTVADYIEPLYRI
ncbi:alpha/beta-hydrolase [Rickenella mellea]|uniref:Alpha/beta-hydrolase n=1 Tax=Rickenella mellea TaxID=50990 RepID=A0A4Y7QIX9_9AGAM|nr:alpha/beta-hydrolase [Rickenella mellea]